ncbi:MAG: tetratricopeptide repeat protein, partial [Phycisphaerales bacterium]|nr:tetratricopeptide repeat protein [Phycisphaerales bacterium]
DLKPGNILIDSAGQPRVLDFGVARSTDADIQLTTARTDVGQLIGTLPYMSPEQASGDPRAIDTRSDVYALGVVLYEVLAGRLPYDVTGRMIHEAVRIVREVEPVPLSSLSRVFRGDLDTIMLRALEKDPARRYQSVLEFAADIRRYLDDEPVRARRPSATYQLRKFARRNKALVLGFAAVFLILLTAVAVISVALAHAVDAEAEAQRQADIAGAVNAFLMDDLLAAADPDRAFDPDVRLQEVLDAAADSLDDRFDGTPTVRAALHALVGRTYVRLGRFDDAAIHLQRALQLMADTDATPRQVLEARLDLADAERGRGHPQGAEAAMAAMIDDAVTSLGPDDDLVYTARSRHGLVLEELGRFDEATSEHETAIDGFSNHYGGDDIRAVEALNGLANLTMQLQHYEEAEPMMLRVLDRRITELGADHPRVAVAKGNLAELYRRMRRYDEAYEIFRELRAADVIKYGVDHPRTLAGTNNYALLCRDMGRLDEARELFEELVELRRRIKGPAHLETMISTFNLALVYTQLQQYDAAAALFRDISDAAARELGEDNWYTGIFVSKRAMVEIERGDFVTAEPHARRAQAILEPALGLENSYTTSNMIYLWKICRADGRTEEAAAWLSRLPPPTRERLLEISAGSQAKDPK